MLTITVASKSKIKLSVVSGFFADVTNHVLVTGVDVSSGVNEQPVGIEEILLGAETRLDNAQKLVESDFYIAIESGIIFNDKIGEWYDVAIAVGRYKNHQFEGLSNYLKFPTDAVLAAKSSGFDTTTVGQVLFETGVVADAKDPHKSLCGTSRSIFLSIAVDSVLKKIDKWIKLNESIS